MKLQSTSFDEVEHDDCERSETPQGANVLGLPHVGLGTPVIHDSMGIRHALTPKKAISNIKAGECQGN
jgi:hypothetical protein